MQEIQKQGREIVCQQFFQQKNYLQAVIKNLTSSTETEKDKKSVEKGKVGTSRESLPEIPSKEE